MRNIEVIENEEVVVVKQCNKVEEKELSEKEYEELCEHIRENNLEEKCFLFKYKSGTKNIGVLKIINYVGYIQLSSVAIEILPKISDKEKKEEARKTLLHMLGETGYLDIAYSGKTNQEYISGNLFEVYGRLFAEKLALELKKGLPGNYNTVEENAGVVRGKIVMVQQIKNKLKKLPLVYCVRDQFSVNQPLNIFLKAVVEFLLKRIKDTKTQDVLQKCHRCFISVEQSNILTAYRIYYTKCAINRLNKRFKDILLLADSFCRNLVPNLSNGNKTAFSILFEMNILFEQYVGKLIEEVLNELSASKYFLSSQEVRKAWEKEKIEGKNSGIDFERIRPDFVIKSNNGKDALVIIDAKWKWDKKITSKDLHQMRTYLSYYELAKAAVLIYPSIVQGGATETYKMLFEPGKITEKKLYKAIVRYCNKEKAKKDVQSILEALNLGKNV